MESNIAAHKPTRKIGFTSATAVLAAIAIGLALVSSLQAADPAELQSKAVLTSGQWRVMKDGRVLFRVFNADGTFTDALFGPANPQPVSAGTWKIGQGRITLTFADQETVQEVFLPINAGMARLIDEHGTPQMMMHVNLPGWVHRPTPQNPANPSPTPAANNAAVPAPAAPVPPDDQHLAAQVIQTYHDSLVFANGKEGSGSGFIATIGKGNYLVTNVHVVADIRDAAFKTLDGVAVQGDAASMAVGEDIMCMALPPVAKPFDIMQGVDSNASIGDTVVVLGNAEGAGVVNTITGRIVGIGPNLIEIDAPFVPGNSGSPIVHLKSGKVIGVATYTVTNRYDLTTDQKLKEPVIRHFGYRLDSVKSWQPVNWSVFYTQAAQLQGIETLTDDIYDFFRDLNENKGHVTLGRHTNPIIKDRIDEWLEAKSHNHSEVDKEEADANLISFLKVASKADITDAQRQVFYDYFARKLADQMQVRGEMEKAFEEILKDVQQ